MKTKFRGKLDATTDITIQLSNIKQNFKRILMSKNRCIHLIKLDVLIDGVCVLSENSVFLEILYNMHSLI